MTSPQVIVLVHTATNYTLSREAEAGLVRRQEAARGTRFVTAFGSVPEALNGLGVRRIAYATPYGAHLTERGRAHLALHGFDVVGVARLEGVRIIYEEIAELAYAVGRQADRPEAEAVFLSSTGMPTLTMLQVLEDDLGKPVISASSAVMWNALRIAGVSSPRPGYGHLPPKRAG
jgi:maleate isomerase